MKNTIGIRFQQVTILILTTAILIALVFYGYRPVSYNLSIGSVCNRDIYAPRSFVDTYQTEYEAVLAKNTVNAIFVRSEEISQDNIEKLTNFYNLVRQARGLRLDQFGMVKEDFSEEFEIMKENIEAAVGVVPSDEVLNSFIGMTSSAFSYIQDKTISMTEIIMMDNINTDSLSSKIEEQVSGFLSSNSAYSAYEDEIIELLNTILTPNSVFDSEATDEAAANAYLTAQSEPVIVDKGTKIVGSGDVVTEHIYRNLVDLELIRDDSFDIVILARVAAYIALIVVITLIYITNSSHHKEFNDMRITYTLIITYLIPVAASVYLSDLSSVMTVTLFFTTICSTYMGIGVGIILSLSNALVVWPLYSFDTEYILISIVGIMICSAISGNKKRRYNSASLIIFPALICIVSSVIYNVLMGATQTQYIDAVVWTGISAAFSIVIAIGLMPIYELFSNAVSPVRLIELSQPGQPLLKRLFIEASGTYHHSMMVANLADSAAEAIGADSQLCRVASYYHDIGKLEHPKYFTENQAEGVNPHDDLSIEESVRIITSHPEDGVKMAKKNRLPETIIKIIDEHHGTTYPAYFYNKAKKEALEQGLPEPDIEQFKYRGHIPSFKESAIVMIADTCEAAIRSTESKTQEEIEALIRKLIKAKIDQDQLIDSGLSFEDLEKIITAFKQVYSGVFHERVKY